MVVGDDMSLTDVEIALAELRAVAIVFYDTRHVSYQGALGPLTRAALRYGTACAGGEEPPLVEREDWLSELVEESRLQGKAIEQLRADVNELTNSFNGLADSVRTVRAPQPGGCWNCGRQQGDHPSIICQVYHTKPMLEVSE